MNLEIIEKIDYFFILVGSLKFFKQITVNLRLLWGNNQLNYVLNSS